MIDSEYNYNTHDCELSFYKNILKTIILEMVNINNHIDGGDEKALNNKKEHIELMKQVNELYQNIKES